MNDLSKKVNASVRSKSEFLCDQLRKLDMPHMLVGNYLMVSPQTSPLYEVVFPSAWFPDGDHKEYWIDDGEFLVITYDLNIFNVDITIDTAENILSIIKKDY
jgi:hypothetical protein